MTIRTVTDPTTPIGDVLKDAAPDGLVLETAGRTQYAVLPMDDDLLDYLLERSPKLIDACRQIRQRMRAGRFRRTSRSGNCSRMSEPPASSGQRGAPQSARDPERNAR